MADYVLRGEQIRKNTKNLITEFMFANLSCMCNGRGLTQAEIFKKCGFGLGDRENATETNQQYWIVAALCELASDRVIFRDSKKRWKLTAESEADRVLFDASYNGGENNFEVRGKRLTEQAKGLLLEYMQNCRDCSRTGSGKRQTELFRECGLDWGDYENAESRRQSFWVIALLRVLEQQNYIFRDENKRWHLS